MEGPNITIGRKTGGVISCLSRKAAERMAKYGENRSNSVEKRD
jgi:hypothetical protein